VKKERKNSYYDDFKIPSGGEICIEEKDVMGPASFSHDITLMDSFL
jgi:hypothetical protein